ASLQSLGSLIPGTDSATERVVQASILSADSDSTTGFECPIIEISRVDLGGNTAAGQRFQQDDIDQLTTVLYVKSTGGSTHYFYVIYLARGNSIQLTAGFIGLSCHAFAINQNGGTGTQSPISIRRPTATSNDQVDAGNA